MEPRIVRGRSGPRLRRIDESQANPVVLDPGNSAFADRCVVRHDQAKALGNKRRVLDIDGGALLVRTKRTVRGGHGRTCRLPQSAVSWFEIPFHRSDGSRLFIYAQVPRVSTGFRSPRPEGSFPGTDGA